VPAMSPTGGQSMCEATKTAVTAVPTPSALSIDREPPVCSAARRSRGSPSPMDRVVRVVVKGSLTRASSSGAMPVPSSRMERVMVFPSSVRVMSRRLAWAVMEFWAISRV